MEIRKSKENDFNAMMDLFDEARGTIALLGINQECECGDYHYYTEFYY